MFTFDEFKTLLHEKKKEYYKNSVQRYFLDWIFYLIINMDLDFYDFKTKEKKLKFYEWVIRVISNSL